MAEEKTTPRTTPSKPPKGSGGGGVKKKPSVGATVDSETEKILQLHSQIAELKCQLAVLAKENETLVKALDREKMRTAEPSEGRAKHESASRQVRKFPDDMHAMSSFLRHAPSFWHFHTLLEVMLQRLVQVTKGRNEQEKDAALKALAEMARKFRTTPKEKRAMWLDTVLKEPAFREVWNREFPKRSRGGTGGDGSPQLVFTFVELTMQQFERSLASRHLGSNRAEMYSRRDEYLAAFLPYAKTEWEDGGREGVAGLWIKEGHKLRANTGTKGEAKVSFGLFKKEISAKVKANLEQWRKAYPP